MGRSEISDFADDGVGREAAGFAADEGDDAEGATVVAAVLDFQNGARVMGFAALDGGGEKFGVGEDVAGEDLGETCVSIGGDRRKKQILLATNARRRGDPRFARNDSFSISCTSSGGRSNLSDEIGDLGLVGIADDVGDAGEGG